MTIDTSTIDGKLAVMQAFKDGAKIEWAKRYDATKIWTLCVVAPSWDWAGCDFRIKPREPREFWLGMSEASGGDEDFSRRGYALLDNQASAEYLRDKCGWHEVIKVREVLE